MGKKTLRIALLSLAACQGEIEVHSTATTPNVGPETPKLVSHCATPGVGAQAKMRLLWPQAYLAELSNNLGPGAAVAAQNVHLSPATDKTFAFDSIGSLLTDNTLESLATTADAVAVWALSTDANAQSVFGCVARTVTGTEAETCFRTFLETKAPRLLRRPLLAGEADEMVSFFKTEALQGETDGEQEGFRQGLSDLLTHPDFLYLRDVPEGQTSHALDPFSLANRISFALTGHGPDDALFAAAGDGSLATSAGLKAQVDRLLASPDTKARSMSFFRQWLGYDNHALNYSPAFLDGLDATGLEEAATAELDGFLSDQTWSLNATPADLLTSRTVPPVHGALASIYGVADGATQLPANRAGLLTRVAMVASGGDDWHVVARGLTVVQKILCKDINPPTFSVADAAMTAASLRVSNVDRINTVTQPAACGGCHKTINPLGDARADFDSIGRAVTVEKHYAGGVFDYEVPVVATANLTVPLGRAVTANGSVDLSTFAAGAPEYDSCFATQLVRQALGRNDSADGCVADDGARTIFAGGTVVEAMRSVMTSSEFALWKE